MEIRFDADQEFQVKAIEAVVDTLDGQVNVSAQVRFQEGTISLAAIANRLQAASTPVSPRAMESWRLAGRLPIARTAGIIFSSSPGPAGALPHQPRPIQDGMT